MNAYENPRLYGVDYRVIDETVEQGVRQAGEAMRNIAEQRKAAYERLQEEFAQFKDLTYLENVRGLDQSTMDAIRQSTNNITSLADFSNRTEYEKSQILNQVKDTRTAMKSMEEMIKLRNSGAILDKRADGKYYNLLSNVSAAKGIRVEPKKDGVGFTLISDVYDKDGNKTGEQRFSESDIAGMTSIIQDVAPTMNAIDEQIDEMTKRAQDGYNKAGKNFDFNNVDRIVGSYVDEFEPEEKSIYFSQRVEEYMDFAPSMIDGKELSKEERENRQRANNQKLKAYIAQKVKERLVAPPEAKPEAPRRLASDPTGDELNASRKIWDDFLRAYSEGDTQPIRKYMTPLGYKVDFNKSKNELEVYTDLSKEEFVKQQLESENITEGEAEEAWAMMKTSSGNKKVLANIPLSGNVRDVAEEFINTVLAKKKLPFVRFAFQENVAPSNDEINRILQSYGYDGEWNKIANPLDVPNISGQMLPQESVEEIRLNDGRVLPQ